MENLTREKTSLTPQIHFQTNGTLQLKGISTPENVQGYYQPVLDWLDAFKLSSPQTINFILELDYLNSPSSKMIIRILGIMNQIKQNGANLVITWRYEEGDEDMLELGKDLEYSSKSEMTFVAIKKS